MTLLRSSTQAGPFTPVTNGDTTVMSPANTANPSATDSAGRFRWDVVTGWYEVSATKAGCTGVGGSNTSAPEHVLPPPASPVTAIKLTLDCGGGLPTTSWYAHPASPSSATARTSRSPTTPAHRWSGTRTSRSPAASTSTSSWNMVLTQVGNERAQRARRPVQPVEPGVATGPEHDRAQGSAPLTA